MLISVPEMLPIINTSKFSRSILYIKIDMHKKITFLTKNYFKLLAN